MDAIMNLSTYVKCLSTMKADLIHRYFTTRLLSGQSVLASEQGSDHYLVAFYDKLSDADLFFLHPDPHGAEFQSKRNISLSFFHINAVTKIFQVIA